MTDDNQNSILTFQVEDYVVYNKHGVAIIHDIQTQKIADKEFVVYILKMLKKDITVSLPINNSNKNNIRKLANEDTIVKSISIIQSKPHYSKVMWSKKVKNYETKIHSGDIIMISKVIRDLSKNISDANRSYSERIIFENALERLVSEISIVREQKYEETYNYIHNIIIERNKNEENNINNEEDYDESIIELLINKND